MGDTCYLVFCIGYGRLSVDFSVSERELPILPGAELDRAQGARKTGAGPVVVCPFPLKIGLSSPLARQSAPIPWCCTSLLAPFGTLPSRLSLPAVADLKTGAKIFIKKRLTSLQGRSIVMLYYVLHYNTQFGKHETRVAYERAGGKSGLVG